MQDIHDYSMAGGGGVGGGGGRFYGGGGGGDRRMRVHGNSILNHHQSLKCPRCNSLNTKFCYYNNYNLSQPRHFCKNCRRYWTKGGVLRNVPVGGGCRKINRSKSKQPSSPPSPPFSADKPLTQDVEDKSSSSESSSLTVSNSTTAAAATAAAAGSSSAAAAGSSSATAYDSTSAAAAGPSSAASAAAAAGPSSAAAAAAAVKVSTSSGFLVTDLPKVKQYENGIEWATFLGQSSSDGGVFSSGFTVASTTETTPFVYGGNSINQQCIDDHLKLDRAAEIDQNMGYEPLDWGRGDQTIFDLTSTVDYAYWSQSQWTSSDQDQTGLYLP